MLNSNQLGMDFATTVRCLAACREANWIIGNIHTVIVWRDAIVLQRSNSLDDALMFRWRQRDSYMALKTMATLREKGHWTCRKIKIYDTRPMRTSGTETSRRNRVTIMHRHLADLLGRFGATEEIKLPECPYFWQQAGVDQLCDLTTALYTTPTQRGIPNVNWMPNQAWLIANQLPLVMRRTDTSRFRAFDNAQWRSNDAPYGSTFAAYATPENVPQRGQGFLWRFPTTPAVITQTTLQLYTWSFETAHEQLAEEGLPHHFERVDITLRSAQPGTKRISTTIRRIHQALQSYYFLKQLTLTIQIADIDEELWTEEDGEPVAAYMLAMMKAAERTQIDTIEEQLHGREQPYRTRIIVMNHLYSQTTSEDVVVNTSAAVRRTLERYAHRSEYQDTVVETAHRRWLRNVKLTPMAITELSTIEADVDIGQIRWRGASTSGDEIPARTHIIDNYRREAIMAIEDHLVKDLQEDA